MAAAASNGVLEVVGESPYEVMDEEEVRERVRRKKMREEATQPAEPVLSDEEVSGSECVTAIMCGYSCNQLRVVMAEIVHTHVHVYTEEEGYSSYDYRV